MARYSETNTSAVYSLAGEWRQKCLIEEKSLLWPDEHVWSQTNLEAFKKHFTDNPDESQRGFEEKFKEQLASPEPAVTKLACELVLIYFLFPSTVSGARKRELIATIASWKNISVDSDHCKTVLSYLDSGIGGPGLAYNTRRPFEISFLGDVALRIASMTLQERQLLLSDDSRLRSLLDEVAGENSRQSRDILLNLLFPDKYERIASRNHKQLIVDAFAEILDDNAPDDLDARLLLIRKHLEKLLPGKELDFYWPPLRQCWYVSGEQGELSPLQGLSIKKQIVLYGPPGTGKTFEARALADTLVRQGVLRAWKPKQYFEEQDRVDDIAKRRVRRVQFHPGYSYEDLVRGLRLTAGGATEYSDGILLNVIAELNDSPSESKDIPFVLILDELNRADLSKVLGECFSLLEDRDAPVQLAGQDRTPRQVSIPTALHVIGTMNLIDQSLEQVDFALRRRFLWFFRGFDREQFLEVCQFRWERLRTQRKIKKEWLRFKPEFETLAERADLINAEIERQPSLGPQYQIGHTYFCDVVDFIQRDLVGNPNRHFVLYSKSGQWRDSTVAALWRYSLHPLLEQYLSGVDPSEKNSFVATIRELLKWGKKT